MEPQPLAVAPESPHLPVPSPIPVLASAFWQALLYGSRDALVSPTDANTAVRLVARELGKDLALAQFTESLRVNTLRKILDGCGAEVWQVMNKLWRAAPPSPDAPVPNEDQSHCSPGVEDCHCSPGVEDCPRSMPAWRREFHQEVCNEQRLLKSLGGWCG